MYSWFRVYHGTWCDPRLAAVARRSGATRSEVLCVWDAVLDYASSQCDAQRGELTGFDAEAVDAIFDFDDGTTDKIITALTDKGMIVDGKVTNWEKLQGVAEREQVAERQRRCREKNKAQVQSDDEVTNGHAPSHDVTDGHARSRDVTPRLDKTRLDLDERERRQDDDANEDLARARESVVGVVGGGASPADPGEKSAATFELVAGLWRERLEPLGFPVADRPCEALTARFEECVRADPARASPDWWRELVERIAASAFLRDVAVHGGQTANARWITLAWVLRRGKDGVPNVDKICAGRYDDAKERAAVEVVDGEPIPSFEACLPAVFRDDWVPASDRAALAASPEGGQPDA